MSPIEALERFTRNIPRDICDFTVRAKGSDCDLWPEAMVAAVYLSGMLEDATSDDDLVAGVQHFQTLYDAEIFTAQQWIDETDRVIGAVTFLAMGAAGR